ncbi:MAG: DUF115 domain-containing protein [Planctomycetota bacterium]|nr:DUF115 domain-containing protein [Planctomycetota bacterium]
MRAQVDSSQRFIAAEDAPILANLAALWESDPELATAIESLDENAVYSTEKSKAGAPTVQILTSDGRRVYLHSRHQPIEEARRLLDGVSIEEKMTFYVLGLGLGYHLEQLFDRASDEAIFCMFEPDLRMIRTALEHRDFSKLIRSHRVMWFYEGEKAQLFQRLTPHTALISMGTEIISHASSRQLNEPFYHQTEIWLAEFAAFCRTNMNTLVLNSRKTAENIAKNIGWYAATPSLARLNTHYQSRPAIIVSAGPSLRKNKHLLAGLEQNAVIIAVQTTLQPLLEMGVVPQFVTSLDYHEICSRFFEKLPQSLTTELIAEPKATCAILDMMTGPVNVIGNDFAEGLLRELNLNKPALTSGATVAHLAFYFAEYLQCDPIIFIGQDLGFSDGLCYAPGTSYEDVWRPELSRFCTVEMKQWEQIIRDRPILRQIPDYQGRPMYTEERLFTYLHQFERDFGKTKARIIDATEGGAAKRGATAMPLAEAIAKYCTAPLPAAPQNAPQLRWDLLESCCQCIAKRKEEAVEIEDISRLTLPLLQEVRDHIADQSRVNRAIARIDELRARMDVLGQTYMQITQFTQQTELTRFERDRRLAAERLSGIDRQQRQVERDIDNVKAVIIASQEFAHLMDEVFAQLTRQSQRKVAA